MSATSAALAVFLCLSSSSFASKPPPPPPPTPCCVLSSLGPQNTLVILVNFLDNMDQPLSVGQMTTDIFAGVPSVNDYYTKVSYGQTTITGTVAGWFTIPYNEQGNCSEWATFGDAARTAAANAGYNLSNYSHFVYVWPSVSSTNPNIACYAALGEMPPFSVNYTESWISIGGAEWNESEMINDFTHELGHNLGLNHADDYKCSTNRAIDSPTNCTMNEYLDMPNDAMGNSSPVLPHELNAPHRASLGWFSPSQGIDLISNGIYTYTLTPLENDDSGLKFLRIPKPDTGEFYYLSYRVATGTYDNQGNNSVGAADTTSVNIWNGATNIQTQTTVQTKMLYAQPWTLESAGLPME